MTELRGTGPAAGRWAEVWANRRLDPRQGSPLAQLLAADGYDTETSRVSETSWVTYVQRWAKETGLGPGTSVFEVGCGAGAFLLPLQDLGCDVSGADQSASLIAIARQALPGGRFDVAPAAELPAEPQADVVVSSGVFMYFPSLDYAKHVIQRMAAKARHAVAILDIPDFACHDAALAHRVAAAGGPEAYAGRYRGLQHLYYTRDWVMQALRRAGLSGACVADQTLPGYANAPFRFNAWGWRPAMPAA